MGIDDKTVSKVAQVSIYFWIMKICATTLGETAGDLLSMTMNVGYAISSLLVRPLETSLQNQPSAAV
jgi:uncharacterized membrane-anchored protein